MRSVKTSRLVIALCALFLSACATTKTYMDTGVYKGENYTFDVTWVDESLFRTVFFSINGDRALTIDREAQKNANCYKTSFYVNRCTYNTQYEDISVEVIVDTDGQMFQQNSYYIVSFDGILVRRITVPLQ